jgi:hypothetical protein
MPRGRKKNSLKKKNSSKNVSKEVQDIFFNTDIKDEEEIVDTTTEETIESPEEILSTLDEDKEVEVPETVPIPDGSINDTEQFTVVASYSDDGEEVKTVQCIRKNQPPPESTWADKKCKFKCGQKIMPRVIKKKDIPNYECAVVISPGTYPDTYIIKISRSLNETQVIGNNWEEASDKCKPYVSFWEANSPPKRIL